MPDTALICAKQIKLLVSKRFQISVRHAKNVRENNSNFGLVKTSVNGKHPNRQSIPRAGINPESVAFSHPKKRPSEHQDNDEFHHNLTIKKPRSANHFAKIPVVC
jgi:hypothetical protein